ncbi:MAG: tRNA (adenosine(37)-N6)-threonylcarbamoyltransferase complex ATPase subunit type 1 TsaE [Candidatus Omnitrophica bacterium]|nr:tRNA (adenosine(37)-N6)-threonylcarbamoyltransferase complex ATPase subunit type 1 TsaE [Candidatus Omnitrophota bacterium]
MKKFVTKNLGQTLVLARKFSRILSKGDVVGFQGRLGAGKTTFIKGIAESFAIKPDEVTSSSFVILKEHRGRLPLYHVDLYRLNSRQIPDEVFELISDKKGLVLIEWADKIEIKGACFKIHIELKSLTSRKITISANTAGLMKKLSKLKPIP